MPRSVQCDSSSKIVHVIEGVKMVVMPTIFAWYFSSAWDHYHVERPFCTMLPAQKPSCILKSSPTHHHASQFDGHVEVQRVPISNPTSWPWHFNVGYCPIILYWENIGHHVNLNIGYVGCAHTRTLKCCKQGEMMFFYEIVLLIRDQRLHLKLMECINPSKVKSDKWVQWSSLR